MAWEFVAELKAPRAASSPELPAGAVKTGVTCWALQRVRERSCVSVYARLATHGWSRAVGGVPVDSACPQAQ